jgi:2-polyprenyl-3-methyl-5-hydroxy-6-metoxy-1,4-benzoquinol methylase
MKLPSHDVLDPVAAYEKVAPFFPGIAKKRKPYLASIDELIVARIPLGSGSLLDVGAGDGTRALQIAGKAGLNDIVLLEPSAGMIKACRGGARIWRVRAEELEDWGSTERDRQFDVITCLWNVLGHVRSAKIRIQVLRQLTALLSPRGLLFLDVNHRYNVRSYGLLRTSGRFLYDRVWPRESNGDVTVSWTSGDLGCRTYGHVFTDREISRLAGEAGLRIRERVVVDYDTGEVKQRGWEGNLLYIFRRRASVSDSCKVSETSCTSAPVI